MIAPSQSMLAVVEHNLAPPPWLHLIPTQSYCGTSAPSATNGGVWYSFISDVATTVTFDLSLSSYDTKLLSTLVNVDIYYALLVMTMEERNNIVNHIDS